MAFSLGFSPEFFFGEGEPYDVDGACLNSKGQPVSLWSAIRTMSPDDWANMCVDCFPGVDPKFVTAESVMDLCRETDTCGTLSVPVDVWIDAEGIHTLNVWDDTVSE
jgi:hypothetical protein